MIAQTLFLFSPGAITAAGRFSGHKTLITHATSQAARFLGYKVQAQRRDTKLTGP
ncbi:hypothetical protein [Streptomyces kanamyceticus]|uniref:hypothetical protein n=1 Tax=Streptomyces kanamyceticus TaxID=1967 RepID=UPI0037DDD96D